MRRDQFIIALGWASALRASELVSLDVEDLTVVGASNTGDGGLIIRVRNAKGADGVKWVAVPFASHIHTCPVRRSMRYTASLRSGPLFRHIDRHGRPQRRLGARPISDIVRRAIVDTLQYDAAGFSSHSLRAGFVTEARAHGVPDEFIARHTRHGRPGQRRGGILNVYDRPRDLFERAALPSAVVVSAPTVDGQRKTVRYHSARVLPTPPRVAAMPMCSKSVGPGSCGTRMLRCGCWGCRAPPRR